MGERVGKQDGRHCVVRVLPAYDSYYVIGRRV